MRVAVRSVIGKKVLVVELFNIISGVCSILGFLISIFVASKVVKISIDNSNKNEIKNIDMGNDGTIIGGDHVEK